MNLLAPRADIGSLMTYVNPATSGITYAELGCSIVQVGNLPPVGLSLNAIHDQHARIQHWGPSPTDPDLFPYAALKSYEGSEIKAGRSPIFATATYNGKQYPVFYYAFPSGGATNGQPIPASWAAQGRGAVNVGDPRYLKFFVEQYLAPIVFNPAKLTTHPQNNWVSFDNGSMRYNLYGIIDETGVWRAGLSWDAYNGMFPVNETQYEVMLESGFAQLKSLLPGLRCMINFGSLANSYQTEVPQLYASIDGAMSESFLPPGTTPFQRAQWGTLLASFSWMVQNGKVIVPRQVLPAPSADQDQVALRTAIVCYLLAAGPTSFFTPSWLDPSLFASGGPAVYPATLWMPMFQALGVPMSPYVVTSPGVYTRRMQRGTVFLNLSGAPFVGQATGCWDHSGNAVSSITIPDMVGDYVLRSLM